MGIFNLFKKQLATVIEWSEQNREILWFQYPSATSEIKNASKLIVGPGQGCVLVYEGKVQDTITDEGVYSLSTDNHPFITTLKKIRQNFESEHKLCVFFFRKAQVVNQQWGTATPVKYVDKTYNIPIEMGANGNFSYKINDVAFLFNELLGQETHFETKDMNEVISGRIPQAISSYLASQSFGYQEIDSQLELISSEVTAKLNNEFAKLGLELTDFRIVGTLFDANTQKRIDKVSDIASDAKAAEMAGLSFVELEKLKALRDAARNEGGMAGMGMQLGAGMELGKLFSAETKSILDDEGEDVLEKLKKLHLLVKEGVLSQVEFDELKSEILKKYKS
ncbi:MULTISPECIES: SPFH domain-containing protein [Myroides]|uniref:SPFH domain-containing protein n=1 Tax=Myroides albus TaxID=2562892 RepID=A0A6I3LKZ5_9FLAO|nr:MULTISPECIES: SPFH domain-containing protein [Myroides]MTG98387.1 SPFH domain-containing protein [Myroides albus]MVX35738.1 SPFH domain-containing protein [Myroides sp. LoEW2-1]UVD80380.1 SPFH domain-containing protein [Myroides albus]